MYLKRFEELWSNENGQPYMICLLTSASIIADGLYMFHPSAHQAAEIYPELSRIALEKIAAANPRIKFGISEPYGFLEIFSAPHGIGIFQVSVHFGDATDLSILSLSVDKLLAYAKAHPTVNIRLPYPGVGFQRWNTEPPECGMVIEELDRLPDNVTVCYWRDLERPAGRQWKTEQGVANSNRRFEEPAY
jgi:hypothetical protein